jgi:hypothetical protein
MKTMFIEWPDLKIKVEAVLEDRRNAALISEIWNHLPMTSIQEHAMVTGKSMYCWVPMLSFAEIPFQMMIKETPPGVVSYSQKTGNKMIVRYGKVTEDLMTPIVGFVREEQVNLLEKVGKAVWNTYSTDKKLIIVEFTKGRDCE